MSRLALVWLLISPPAAAAPARAPFGPAYWYLDIGRPFFVRDGAWMLPSRPGSRARAFLARKPAGTFRVFVIGGSVAAQYDSEPDKSYGRTLEKVLAGLSPGRPVEVIHCGMPAYDSYRESLIAREVLAYAPDAVVLMSGNNEASELAGPPPAWAVLALRVRRLLGRLAPAGPAPPERSKAPREYARPFEANVRAMTRAVQARGARMVLCALPRQLGLPPDAPLPLGDPAFARAWALIEGGRWSQAQAELSQYTVAAPREPLGHVWLGRLLERRGRTSAARAEYRRALEVGCHVPRLNRVLRALAAQEHAALVDLEQAFLRATAGARDETLLNDEMHWNRFADPLVSAEIARALAPLLGPASGSQAAEEGLLLVRRGPTPEEREELYFKRLGKAFWSAGEQEAGFSEGAIATLERLDQDYPGRLDALARPPRELARELAARIADSAWMAGPRGEWRSAWGPGLGHLAEAFRRRGRLREALACFSEALRAAPGREAIAVHRAMTLAALGRRAEALSTLAPMKDRDARFPELCAAVDRCAQARPARKLRPDLLEAALARLGRGEWERGFRQMDRATSGFSREALGALDRQCGSQAIDCGPWRRAQDFLRGLNDDGIRALAAGDAARAAGSFDAVLRLYPSQPSALINGAVAAASRGDLAGALAFYGRALASDLSAPGLESEVLSARATALERLGRRAEAAADLKTALIAAPPGWPRSGETRERLARLGPEAR